MPYNRRIVCRCLVGFLCLVLIEKNVEKSLITNIQWNFSFRNYLLYITIKYGVFEKKLATYF